MTATEPVGSRKMRRIRHPRHDRDRAVGSRKMRRIRHPRHDRDRAGGFTENEANKASTA